MRRGTAGVLRHRERPRRRVERGGQSGASDYVRYIFGGKYFICRSKFRKSFACYSHNNFIAQQPSMYLSPHTWVPCVPNSLTHRLHPCGHLIVTDQLEMCGRNCLVSESADKERMRDLDRVFLCPCPHCSTCPICSIARHAPPKAGTRMMVLHCKSVLQECEVGTTTLKEGPCEPAEHNGTRCQGVTTTDVAKYSSKF